MLSDFSGKRITVVARYTGDSRGGVKNKNGQITEKTTV